MLKKRIEISTTQKKQIAKELKVSKTWVQLALDHVYDSPKCKAIRRRAKELLQGEINKIED
jgi:hypothetical protein